MNCIDLKERFGKRYRIGREEGATIGDPWGLILRCRYGHVYPFGGSALAASVDGFPKVAATLKRLPCVRVHQDGDFGEATVVFHVEDFAKVARVLRPYVRKRLTEAGRARAVENLKLARQTQYQKQLVAQDCEVSPSADILAVQPENIQATT